MRAMAADLLMKKQLVNLPDPLILPGNLLNLRLLLPDLTEQQLPVVPFLLLLQSGLEMVQGLAYDSYLLL